jgi:bacillithiol biosynthesis deacetylase BshB1
MNGTQIRGTYDVVAFGAHPDDVEMGMGGTIAALVAAARRVAIVDLTRGELGTHGDGETRIREAETAAGILGCERRILDYGDGAVADRAEFRREIVTILRQLRPSLIFAPYPRSWTGPLDGRSNVDHLACGSLVHAAAKLARLRKLMPELEAHTVRRIFYYMAPDDRPPSFVVDVSAHRDPLVRSIEAFASQMAIRRGSRSILDVLLLLREHAGLRIGAELGEAFICEDSLGGDAELLLHI